MSNSRDQELIERCQQGDRRALEELLGYYQRPVYNAAFRMLGNPQDASDVTQVVFLKVFEHLDRYDPKYKFFSWIYRIAINETINQINRGKREQMLDEQQVSGDRGPAEKTEAALQSMRVQEALMTLQEDYRMVVVLRHFSELSYREISEALHIPVVTVKSRLYTARQQLKDCLSEAEKV
jgi:RNA polymerase sigma-70 factor (ECF subfamily)